MRQSLSHPTACSCDIWGVLGVLRKQDCKETLRLEEEDRVFFLVSPIDIAVGPWACPLVSLSLSLNLCNMESSKKSILVGTRGW